MNDCQYEYCTTYFVIIYDTKQIILHQHSMFGNILIVAECHTYVYMLVLFTPLNGTMIIGPRKRDKSLKIKTQ